MVKNSAGWNPLRLKCTTGLAVVMALAVAPMTGAQAVPAVYDDGGADNDWSTAANWNPDAVPNGAFEVEIDAGGAFNVDLDQNAIVNSLTIGADDSLDIENGRDLFIDNGGTVLNDGTINFQSIGTLTDMNFLAGGDITGAGTFNFSNITANRLLTAGSTTLTQGPGHTLAGAFTLLNNAGSFVNNGTINATGTQSISIDPEAGGSFTNNGTMNATGGGGFVFNAGIFNNNTQIDVANGSKLDVQQGAKIVGGTLNTTGTGVVNVNGTSGAGSEFQDVTINGTVVQNNSEDATITGTFDLNGTWQMNSIGTTTDLDLNGGVTLNGNGVIDMSNVSTNRILTDGNDVIIGSNFTIRGAGQLMVNTADLTNNGTIQNDQTQTLTIDVANTGAGFVNNGTLELLGSGDIVIGPGDTQNNGTVNVAGSGNLDVGAGTFTNTGQTVTLDNGGDLEVSQGTVFDGGTIQSNDAGSQVIINGTSGAGSTLTNVTVNADITQANARDATVTGGFTHNGTWFLNSVGTTTDINLNDGVVLNGTGKIQASNTTANRIVTNNTVITFGANYGFEGAGTLLGNSGGLVNNGTIDATGTVVTVIDPNALGLVNNGTINALGLGGIDLFVGVYTNNGSINVADGSTVDLFDGTIINGGTLTSAGTGKFVIKSNTAPGAVLNNVTLNGNVEQANARDATVTGSFTHNGVWDMNSLGTITTLNFDGGVTVNGNSLIDMSNSTGNQIRTDDTVMTLGANAKIQGAGNILANSGGMVNNGTIDATGTVALTIDPNGQGFVNNGTMNALGSGGFSFGPGTFTNNASIDVADGSQLAVGNSTVVDGGVINTAGAGVVNLNGTDGTGSVFNNVTVNGDLFQNNNEDSTFTGSFTHNAGTFAVNSLGTFTELDFNGGITIDGNGVMTFSNSTGNRLLTDNTVVTVGNSYTIQGAGNILANSGGMVNNGTIEAIGSVALTIDPNGLGFVNNGTIQGTGTGGFAFGPGTFTNNAAIDIGDTSQLAVGNGTVVNGGVVQTAGTGVVNLNGTDGTGSVFNNVTVNGDLFQNNNEDSTFTGTFTHNNGTFAVNSLGTLTFVNFDGGATVTGTGVMDLSNSTGNRVQTDGTTMTVGAGYTIEGSGDVLNNTGGMTLQGTLRGNNSVAMNVNPGNGQQFDNQGLVEATNGATVNFTDSSEVANVQGGGTELVGGKWKADTNSTINLTGAAIMTNNADVTLNGAGSTITQMANFDTNGPQGTFRVEGGRVFNTAANLTNSGTVEINGAASQINVTNIFTQTGGQTTLNGGTLASLSGPAQFTGGAVNGSGTIMGGATFTGTSVIDTGASPGIIAIAGDVLFDSTILTELDGVLVDAALPSLGRINAGTDPLTTEFDQINVAGTATLGTNLVIDVTAGFSAVHGDFFDVLTADVIAGTLGSFTLNLPTNFTASIVTLNDLDAGFDRDALRLTYVDPSQVPVPGGLAMMLPALLGGSLLFRRRNKRNAN